MRWGGAVRRLEIAGKRLLSKPGNLSLCAFDSFIWPNAPWICLICHKLRKLLKFEPAPNPGVITGGWRLKDGTVLREGGWLQERFGRKPTPWAHWWPAHLVDPHGRNVEQYVRTFFTLGRGNELCREWGLPLGTTFEMDIYLGEHGYVRVDAHHPTEAKYVKYTLFIP